MPADANPILTAAFALIALLTVSLFVLAFLLLARNSRIQVRTLEALTEMIITLSRIEQNQENNTHTLADARTRLNALSRLSAAAQPDPANR